MADSIVIGVVLAGGRSRRMGSDKAELVFRGHRLVEWMVGLVRSAIGERAGEPVQETSAVWISGEHRVSGAETVRDETPGLGPIGGLCALAAKALATVGGDLAFLIVPVDMPLLRQETLRRLLSALEPQVEAVHFTGFELPLVLRLNEATSAKLRALLDEREPSRRSLRGLLGSLRVCELVQQGNEAREFINANTREEWEDCRS